MSKTSQVSKKLTANDLGLTGSHQAGINIPRDPRVLDFFPKLDTCQYNPDLILSVATPQTGNYWQLRYIYYNSKTLDQGTRNEYRLTGTTRMLRDLDASVGDTLLFSRSTTGDIEVTLERKQNSEFSALHKTVLKNGWHLTVSD